MQARAPVFRRAVRVVSARCLLFLTRKTPPQTSTPLDGLLRSCLQALSSLRRNFVLAGTDKTTAFVEAALAGTTYLATDNLGRMEKSPLFNKRARKVLKDFGPALAIVGLTVFNAGENERPLERRVPTPFPSGENKHISNAS